ncbi:hypothetical protein NDU88_007651 [Pleurodeles waltl]|uniref:Uncharacterized protein n=1 Tax=Pleurodeles waltl TaxID=8319 RepID=A0AAV7PQK7_PLEWA|nr:hypothetical protein NDU88_007651 [Pleurodeles waltl]
MARATASLSLQGERLCSAGSTSGVSGAAPFPPVELLQAYVRCPSRSCLHPCPCYSVAQRLHFSLPPGSRAQPSFTGPRQRSMRGFFSPVVGCTCSAPIALDLRPHTGSPAVYLSGTGAPSPRGWYAR